MSYRVLFAFAILLGACAMNVRADIFYVDRDHPGASDSNAGTEEFPWRTIVHAAEVAGVGDTVLIKAGVYQDGDVEVMHSGAQGQELVFSAYPGHEHQAIIKGGRFLSIGNSHIVVRGLKVLESPSHGFRFEGPRDASEPPAENITISGNHTYDTCGSGISVWGVKWGYDPVDFDNIRDVVIEDNLLELGTHGCKGEIITVAGGAVNVTVRNNEIRLGDPAMEGGDEGIDFKEGVRDSAIYGNYIHHLSDKAIYIDGGSDPRDPLVSNIHIYNNIMMHLPSAGISIVTEGMGDVDGIYVYNNLVAHTDGDGFLVYDHPGGAAEGGTVKNVHFINNTAIDAGHDHGGGLRVNHSRATGIVFRNNIAWNNADYDIRGEAETLIEGNLCRESFCGVQEDPRFIDPQNDDYRLRADSPAIDRGLFEGAPAFDILGTIRPQGSGPDLGAYEHTNSDTGNGDCTAGKPTLSLSPSSQSALPGETVQYSVSVTNNDSQACNNSTFALNAVLPQGWPGSLSPTSLNLAPGKTGTATFSVASADDAVDGTHGVVVNVADATENMHAANASASYIVLETCTAAAPGLSLSPDSQSGDPGATLMYTVTLVNKDSPACGANTFDLTIPFVPSGWSGSLSTTHLSLSPGATGSATLSVTSASTAIASNYSLQVAVSDAHEAVHAKTITATYVVNDNASTTDSESPSTPTGLTASENFKHVSLSWNASSDNVGVAGYRIYRNGVKIADITDSNYTDNDGDSDVMYEYTVDAYDRAGNGSAMSNPVVAGKTKSKAKGGGGGKGKGPNK